MAIVQLCRKEIKGFDGSVELKGVWVLPRVCPLCGGPLVKHGCYWRWVSDGTEACEHILIARMRCKACRVTMAVLPHFLAAFYVPPYQATAIFAPNPPRHPTKTPAKL